MNINKYIYQVVRCCIKHILSIEPMATIRLASRIITGTFPSRQDKITAPLNES
jgi:hypothetical protein